MTPRAQDIPDADQIASELEDFLTSRRLNNPDDEVQ